MWATRDIVVFCVPIVMLAAGVIAWLFLRKTVRTRLRMAGQLENDRDINEWLVAFNWSRKILYIPTITVALVSALLMGLKSWGVWSSLDAGLVGGIWLGVFFVNFLVDEYEISVKILLIGLLCVLAVFLWLALLDWVHPFMRFFRHLAVKIDATGYIVLASIFTMAIGISWVKGLFYYVAVTPNYMNIQIGPTETGEQVAREDYSTRVDTGDFLERLFGFGRIIITFRDQRRQPIMLLVNKIGKRAAELESIRGKLAVDRYQAPADGGEPPTSSQEL